MLAEMESLTKLIYRVQKNDKGEVVGRLNRQAAAAIDAVFFFAITNSDSEEETNLAYEADSDDEIDGTSGSTAQQLMMKHSQLQEHAYVTPFEIFQMYERTRMCAVVASCCLHFDRAFDVTFRALRARLTLGLSLFPRCVCAFVCVCARGGGGWVG